MPSIQFRNRCLTTLLDPFYNLAIFSVSDPTQRILLLHFSTYQLHHLGHCDVVANCAALRSIVTFIQTHITSNKMAFHHTNFYG